MALGFCGKIGASEGIRTLDTHVGNVMLYQAELRSLPNRLGQATEIPAERKPPFAQFFCPNPRRESGSLFPARSLPSLTARVSTGPGSALAGNILSNG